MTRPAYYNEIDPVAAQWLRNLIDAGHIAPGIVDERSIEDVRPGDLEGFAQCHFFAGIGVWSRGLRQAGWPDDRPVWTGSCPCQPFSAAGKGAGFSDERHLWPAWHYLIQKRKPAAIFGEQVASKDADPWIDLVHTDMEALGYAFGAVPFPSAGIGAPHIRDRLYWVAHTHNARLEGWRALRGGAANRVARQSGMACGMADASEGERGRRTVDVALLHNREKAGRIEGASYLERNCELGRVAHTDFIAGEQGCSHGAGRDTRGDAQERSGLGGHVGAGRLGDSDSNGSLARLSILGSGSVPDSIDVAGSGEVGGAGPVNGFWRDADWLGCTDAKWRPVEPGTFPLADGTPARVGRLRAYGNAINAEQAREFIEAVGWRLGLQSLLVELAA